jgi:hypothetical protein
MVRIPINLNAELDDEFFDDLICTMFEGGSNYWIDCIEIDHPDGSKPRGVPNSTWVAEALRKNGSVSIYPLDDEVNYQLTEQKLIAGVQMWADKYPDKVSIVHNIIDSGDIDANEADAILQYALFKELVFG